MHFSEAALDTPLDSPFSANLSVLSSLFALHGLHAFEHASNGKHSYASLSLSLLHSTGYHRETEAAHTPLEVAIRVGVALGEGLCTIDLHYPVEEKCISLPTI